MKASQQNAAVLARPAMRSFLAQLESGGQGATSRSTLSPLPWGFHVALTEKDQRQAAVLNSVYESLVWGDQDDADNRSLCADERPLVKQLLSQTVYGLEVLEVGAGSGRFTKGLLAHSSRVVALDREALNCRRLQKNLGSSHKLEVRVGDFAKRKDLAGLESRFSAVFLMENLLGMNPESKVRRELFRNVHRVLRKGGLGIFGFRVLPLRRGESPDQIRYQAMPYDWKDAKGRLHKLYGVAVNWTEAAFAAELEASGTDLQLVQMIPGAKRPAGGHMHFALVQKPVESH